MNRQAVEATVQERGVLATAVRVAGGVLRDRIAPKLALDAGDLPGSVDRITPNWLTAVMCDGIPGAKVLGLEKTHGDSGSSTRQGFALELNQAAQDSGIPERIFTKSAPGFIQRMFLGLTRAAEGEALFFRHVRPRVDLEAPRAWFARFDPASFRCMTVMEDLSFTRRARFISTETHITKPMMADLLANLAKLHARFWQMPELDTDLRFVRNTSDYLAQIARFIDFPKRAFLAMDRYPHLLPDAVSQERASLWLATIDTYRADRSRSETILHGDAHIGQTYICEDGRMGWSDWQLIQRGSWAADFAYAVASALTVEDRRAWEAELLDGYREALRAAGGPDLDIDEAWREYRRHTLYPFFAWAFTRAGAGGVMPDMQPDAVCNDIMSRTAQAVADLDPLGATPR